MTEPTCTCGGRDLCTVCLIRLFDNDPYSRSVDAAYRAVDKALRDNDNQPVRSLTVADLPRMNRGGLNSPQTAYEQHRIQTELK